MRNIVLYTKNDHDFILLNESDASEENGLPSNQYLIRHKDTGVLLDPGGFGVMPSVLTELNQFLPPSKLKGIFLSHQDPDIVGGLTTWMEITKADIYVSKIWLRFLPHYGIRDMKRFIGVGDGETGYTISPGFKLNILPAHFLHSPGQINVYDPVSKILFSGDVGGAVLSKNQESFFVDDFKNHIPKIESFHKRYMASNKALQVWLATIKKYDIEMIAPQHGPIYRGKAVADFKKWLSSLKCGVDLMKGK